MNFEEVKVTIYAVNADGTAWVRAKGRMDLEPEISRTDALDALRSFTTETFPLIPGDDRRFLIAAATFPAHGEIAVTGLGVEVEAIEPQV